MDMMLVMSLLIFLKIDTDYRRRVFNRENIILIIYLKRMLLFGKILVVSVILHFFIKYW